MLNIVNLCKKYNSKYALQNLNIRIGQGEIGILVGENGAGKTTTINSIAGLLKYEGNIEINGIANTSVNAKRMLGIVPEVAHPYDNLTVYEHMEYIAKAYKISYWQNDAEDLLKRFNMLEESNKLGKELSKGMRQKLNICMTLLHNPKVIIFDEPIIGLDPMAITEMKKIITERKDGGCAILICTHILDTVDGFWDKAFILSKGKLIKEVVKSQLSETTSLEEVYVSALNMKQGD